MLLASITPYGWSFIIAIVLGIALTKGVVKRTSPNEKPGCFSYSYIGLIITILMVFVLTFSMLIGKSVYGFFAKPKYTATIVSYSSHWEDRDEKTSSGRTKTTRVEMYTPRVQFTDRNGQSVTIETNISSGSKPEIGDQVTVVYSNGDMRADELSFASIGLLFGASLMIFIMGLILFAAFQYARGADMQGIKNFAGGFLMRFLFPFGMLFLLVGMGYALWQYLIGNRPDMPLWAAIVCGFFCLVLLLVLPVFLKSAYAGKDSRQHGQT